MLTQEVPPSLGPVRGRLSRLLRLFYGSRDSALNLILFPSLSFVSGLWDIHRVFTLSSTAAALRNAIRHVGTCPLCPGQVSGH